jgi:protein SCO1/2
MKARAVLLTIAAAIATVCVSPVLAGGVSQPLPALDRVMAMNPPRVIAPFALTDQHGKTRAWSSFAGTPTLIFFGFTHCPDICPTTLQRIAQLKASQPAALHDLRVVMISVDGERDSPAALGEYLASFSKDFVGLTGPAAQVHEIALRFAAPFFKDAAKGSNYLVQHSSRLYAVDRQGRLRAELYDATPEVTATLARALLAER